MARSQTRQLASKWVLDSSETRLSLLTSHYRTDRRFGKRNRGYLAHLPKTFSPPLLAEMQQLWSEELAEVRSPLPARRLS